MVHSQRDTVPPAVSDTSCTHSHLGVCTLHTSADTGWNMTEGGRVGVGGRGDGGGDEGVAREARVGAEATESGSQVSWFYHTKCQLDTFSVTAAVEFRVPSPVR
ncbi:unnamed protein product [Boreogadus saida]